jgi:outer membrane murein-binding lipoprotein Lpp
MTQGEKLLYRRRFGLIVAALLFLGGGVTVALLLITQESHRADQLATEADLRGNAVSTLAGDVRALRQQVKARGGTPVAPDPTKAVPSLSARAEVPVPIPGPPGPPGPSGKAAPTITPSPGASGASGQPGANSTVAGPQGPQGEPGADSTASGPQGEKGDAGPPPSGYTIYGTDGTVYECTEDGDGSTHYTCRPTSTPSPTDSPSPTEGGLGLALFVATGAYRRVSGPRAD